MCLNLVNLIREKKQHNLDLNVKLGFETFAFPFILANPSKKREAASENLIFLLFTPVPLIP